MFYFICVDRWCVVRGESKLRSFCVLTDGALVQGRVIFFLYVYRQMVCFYMGW